MPANQPHLQTKLQDKIDMYSNKIKNEIHQKFGYESNNKKDKFNIKMSKQIKRLIHDAKTIMKEISGIIHSSDSYSEGIDISSQSRSRSIG